MPAPARTSRDEILTAARHIMERDGFEGLTMQRVADAVGVRAPSLYKHVASRGELVRSVIDDVASQLDADLGRAVTGADPREDLESMARAFRRFAHANPRAYQVVFGPLPEEWRPSLATLAAANEAALATVARLAGPDVALEGARLLVAWAHGFVSMELAGAFRLGGDVDAAFAFGIDRLGAALSGRP